MSAKLPTYLNIAVAVLGLAAYFASFGPSYHPQYRNSAECDAQRPARAAGRGGSAGCAACRVALVPKAKSHVTVLRRSGYLRRISMVFGDV